jgi:hypothetical protein
MRATGTEKEVEICATNINMHVRALSQFLLYIFLLCPTELAWFQVIK